MGMTTEGVPPEAELDDLAGVPWTVGLLVPSEGANLVGAPAGFTPVLELNDEEHSRLVSAVKDLNLFNLCRLAEPIHTAGLAFLEEVDTVTASGAYFRGEPDAVMAVRTKFEATLTAFTAAHRAVEAATKRLDVEYTDVLGDEFNLLRSENHWYLFVWQLRNLSQHHKFASDFIDVGLIDDAEVLTIDTSHVLEYADSLELGRNHRRPWTELHRLLANKESVVPVSKILFEARKAYDIFVARMLARSAPYVCDKIELVGNAYAAAMAAGSGGVIVRREAGDTREQWVLDPRCFEGAVQTLNWMCEQMGMPLLYDIPEEGIFTEPPTMIWANHRKEE